MTRTIEEANNDGLMCSYAVAGVTKRVTIGTWVVKTDSGEVRTTYEWDESKNFIRARFTIKTKGETVSGSQMIGKDPGYQAIKAGRAARP